MGVSQFSYGFPIVLIQSSWLIEDYHPPNTRITHYWGKLFSNYVSWANGQNLQIVWETRNNESSQNMDVVNSMLRVWFRTPK